MPSSARSGCNTASTRPNRDETHRLHFANDGLQLVKRRRAGLIKHSFRSIRKAFFKKASKNSIFRAVDGGSQVIREIVVLRTVNVTFVPHLILAYVKQR